MKLKGQWEATRSEEKQLIDLAFQPWNTYNSHWYILREPVSRSGTNRLLTNDAYERLLVDLTYPNNSKFDSYQYFVEKFCFFQEIHVPDFGNTIVSKIRNELCKMNEIQSCEMRLRNKQVSTKLETPLFQNGYICFVSLLFWTSALLGSTWGSTSTQISTSDF